MTRIADFNSSTERYVRETVSVEIVYSDFGLSAAGNASRDIAEFPPGSIILGVQPHVGAAFNATGNDLLEIGHANDPDAFYTSTSVAATGVMAAAPGAEIGKKQADAVTVAAKYTCTTDAPSAGSVRVNIDVAVRVGSVYG